MKVFASLKYMIREGQEPGFPDSEVLDAVSLSLHNTPDSIECELPIEVVDAVIELVKQRNGAPK